MDNVFTNWLLSILGVLISAIAWVFYNKLEDFQKDVHQILLRNVESRKDLERLEEIVDDHEERITVLEKK